MTKVEAPAAPAAKSDADAQLDRRNGWLLFGGVDGFNLFDPRDIRENKSVPPVVLTGFQILNRAADPSALQKGTVELSYRDAVVAFEFAALDFTAPDRNRYMSKLEGFEQGRRFAQRTHFRVRSRYPVLSSTGREIASSQAVRAVNAGDDRAHAHPAPL